MRRIPDRRSYGPFRTSPFGIAAAPWVLTSWPTVSSLRCAGSPAVDPVRCGQRPPVAGLAPCSVVVRIFCRQAGFDEEWPLLVVGFAEHRDEEGRDFFFQCDLDTDDYRDPGNGPEDETYCV